MVEPVNDNILNLVNELYNNLDAKDKIINEQALEIARLKKDNEYYVNDIADTHEENWELGFEIENLKKEIKKLDSKSKVLEEDYEIATNSPYIASHEFIVEFEKTKKELQQKIDKAIEYIKESCVYDEDDGYEEKIYSLYVPTLLEILGDKENE